MAKTIQTVNPANNSVIKDYLQMDQKNCLEIIEASHAQFDQWRFIPMSARASTLLSLSKKLVERKKDLAHIITCEMGKPVRQSMAEVDKCVGLIEYACTNAKTILAPEIRGTYSVHHQPLGVIYGIMPWNFPVWQTLRFAVPTLLAGNTVVLKPAENVSGTALLLQECFDDIDALKRVYSTLLIDHETSDAVIASDLVRGVSLTGSSRAGSHVAQVAGRYLKKCVLELGGNDAYIICKDADLDLAVEKVFQARLLNTGQSCISAKRIFVHTSIQEQFIKNLIQKIEFIKAFEPTHNDCEFGPIARKDLLETLSKQVQQILKEGGHKVYQKNSMGLEKEGNYFPITVLSNMDIQSSIHSEELFGPVYSIIAFANNEELIKMVNSSPYGLGGAIFSKDEINAKELALKVETGSMAINDYFRSTFDRPFGGLKKSGFGRELGPEGFKEFTNLKVII